MIKCDWIYCKYNGTSGVCNCKDEILLRCATIEDLIDEDIVKNEIGVSTQNCGNVLICKNYISMD